MNGNLTERVEKGFIYSSTVSLIITALAKLASAFGGAAILDSPDLLFPIKMRFLLCLVGIIELIVVALLLSQAQIRIKVYILLWLALSFCIYKASMWSLHASSPCPCLGTITASIGITPKTAASITDGLLVYYLAGSLICLGLNDKGIVNKT
jgi:hypothetical protein